MPRNRNISKPLYFLPTPNCNLNCKYCFQITIPDRNSGRLNYHNQHGVHANDVLIQKLVRYVVENQIDHIEIFGGEPLYYPSLFKKVINTLSKEAPSTTIGVVTNGTLITEEIMTMFETLPISILLSLDGTKAQHDSMRGGFNSISKWFSRLANQGNTSVAMQAARIEGLYDNISFIWSVGLKEVHINLIENYGWYNATDIARFEYEYEKIILAMLQGKGEAFCALNMYDILKQSNSKQYCGITCQGLACDWNGLLYPCQRAVELGSQMVIGDIEQGINPELNKKVRQMITIESFHSASAREYPVVSYCPIAIYQEHKNFNGIWNSEFCEMMNLKAKLVSKYYHEINAYLGTRNP
ncbi:MAG: radical SAM protein [Ignavibacteriaceae bacterium]